MRSNPLPGAVGPAPRRAARRGVSDQLARSRQRRPDPARAAPPAPPATPPGDDDPEAAPPTRRAALGAALAAAAGAACPPPPPAAAPPPPPPPPPGARVREARFVLRVTALRGSVPAAWTADFGRAMEGYGAVALSQRASLGDILRDLRGGGAGAGGAPTTADAVTLGDAWLARAVGERLVRPLPGARAARWWRALGPRWRRVAARDARGAAARDPDDAGACDVYGAPYRWGCTLVGYRRDRLARRGGGGPVADWPDLLRPALAGRLAWAAPPRELVAVALRTLGLPLGAGAADAAACGVAPAAAAARLARLAAQVRAWGAADAARALAAGDVDAVVGASEDVLPLAGAARGGGLALCAPASGAALWADLWCCPAGAAGGAADGEPSPLLPAWAELGLQPARAARSRGLQGGASPLLLPDAGAAAPPRRRRACDLLDAPPAAPGPDADLGPRGLPSRAFLAASEFLAPLSPEDDAFYGEILGLAALARAA